MSDKEINLQDMNEKDRSQTLLRLFAVRPGRARGQNFLVDEAALGDIAALGDAGDGLPLLEIGPGLGALTRHLVERASSLTAVELQREFALYLQAQYVNDERVSIIHGDALTFDYENFQQGRAYRLYANVPYNITTPLLERLLLRGGAWQSMTLLLQEEAARRICAGQGRENSPLTLLAAYYAECEICFTLPPAAFYPPPAVNSAVALLRRRSEPPVEADYQQLAPIIKAAFSQRRKTLVNALSAALPADKDFWRRAVLDCGLDPACRGEQLGLAEFAALARLYVGAR